MNSLYNTILSPIITEKATKVSENNQFVFKVNIDSNKKEIKKAIQVEKETYGNQKVLDRIKGIKKVEGFFEELKEAVVWFYQ